MENQKKREDRNRVTKAGLMEKHGDEGSDETAGEEPKSEGAPSAPKMSKENAEGAHDDKPIH